VSGQNGVEIYQIENNGSIRLITTIAGFRGHVINTHKISLSDQYLYAQNEKIEIYSIGNDAQDFSLLNTVNGVYPYSGGEHDNFASGNQFVTRGNRYVGRGRNEDPAKPYQEELHYWNVYRVVNDTSTTKIVTLMTPAPEDVVGDLSGNAKGTLQAYIPMGYPLLHNGVVALPIYARFDSGEWMYVVRMSVDQNSTLSIHEPSAPGRISSMVMDEEQLIVHHNDYETGSFVDSFRLNDGNRTTTTNTPGSNEKFGHGLALEGNRAQLYSASGPLVYDGGIGMLLIPNKTLSLPLPLSESSIPVAQYPSSSGKFALTENFFVSLDTYTSNNLQNNPETYNVIRVYPKAVNPGPSSTHTVDLNSSVNLEMIWVEPGTFTMGSPVTEEGRNPDPNQIGTEKLHEVTLTKGFYLGKYEVTQAQYEAVMVGNNNNLNPKPSLWPNNSNHPVEMVSWNDTQIFFERLNAAESLAGRLPEGWMYALPTEAEWEYACRAGTTTRYSWGNDFNSSYANVDLENKWDYDPDLPDYVHNLLPATREVGHYEPNQWGFYDMHGNVWEWVQNWTETWRDPIGDPVTDPLGPTSGTHRAKRGGSWLNHPYNARSAERRFYYPNEKMHYFGFRVAFKRQ
jgi:formylglycine-generating enzyme required for sulfatase activity